MAEKSERNDQTRQNIRRAISGLLLGLQELGDQAAETIRSFSQERKVAGEKKNLTTVQLPGSTMLILLPEGYERVWLRRPAAPGKLTHLYGKRVENSENIVEITRMSAAECMPFDSPEEVVAEVRGQLADNMGLIEVRCGETARGYRYVYSLIKMLEDASFGGVRYSLVLQLGYGTRDRVQICAQFREIGTTGLRESTCMNLARELGLVEITEDGLQGWMQDPYGPAYQGGVRKNLSEMEGLDGMFPEHPLSQAREFLLSVLLDEYVTDDTEQTDTEQPTPETEEENSEERGKELLRDLFRDGCRRPTTRISLEAYQQVAWIEEVIEDRRERNEKKELRWQEKSDKKDARRQEKEEKKEAKRQEKAEKEEAKKREKAEKEDARKKEREEKDDTRKRERDEKDDARKKEREEKAEARRREREEREAARRKEREERAEARQKEREEKREIRRKEREEKKTAPRS